MSAGRILFISYGHCLIIINDCFMPRFLTLCHSIPSKQCLWHFLILLQCFLPFHRLTTWAIFDLLSAFAISTDDSKFCSLGKVTIGMHVSYILSVPLSCAEQNVKSLSRLQILVSSKLKAYVDDNKNVNRNLKFALGTEPLWEKEKMLVMSIFSCSYCV